MYAHLVELEKCCQTHIFLQTFVLIQPRTSPPKIAKFCEYLENRAAHPIEDERVLAGGHRVEVRRLRLYWQIFGKICRQVGKFSAKFRSFSAVSAPIFATKYAFCRIFQNLPNHLAEIFEIKFWQILHILRHLQKLC